MTKDELLAAGRRFWQEDKDSDPALTIVSDGIVRVRKRTPCCAQPANDEKAHNCEPGTMAYREKAILDGKWTSSYVCQNCLTSQET